MGKKSGGFFLRSDLIEAENAIKNAKSADELRYYMEKYKNNSDILARIARNSKCDEQIFDSLSQSDNERVLYAVALQCAKIKNEKILIRLVMNRRLEVRAAVMLNTKNESIKKLIINHNKALKQEKKFEDAMTRVKNKFFLP